MELGAADHVKHQGQGEAEIASRGGTRQHSRTSGAMISEQRNHRRSDSIWKTLTTIFFATYCAIDLLFRGLFWWCIAFVGFTMMLTCFLCLYINCNLFPRTVPFNLIKFSHISPTMTLSIASNHTHLLAILTIAPASSIGSHRYLIFPVYSASPCG